MTEPKYKLGEQVEIDTADEQFCYGPIVGTITRIDKNEWGFCYDLRIQCEFMEEVPETFLHKEECEQCKNLNSK